MTEETSGLSPKTQVIALRLLGTFMMSQLRFNTSLVQALVAQAENGRTPTKELRELTTEIRTMTEELGGLMRSLDADLL